MSRVAKDKPYKTLVAGFITEATGLTFPENSAQDIDNCDIELKGTVRRRLGLTEEADGVPIGSGDLATIVFPAGSGGYYSTSDSGTLTVQQPKLAVTVHQWPHPGGHTNLNFVVFQVGNKLIVRNWDAIPISDVAGITTVSTGPFEFDVGDPTTGMIYSVFRGIGSQTPLQSSSGFGHLWFTSKNVFPFYLQFNEDTSISLAPVGYDAANPSYVHGRFDIRDFNGVPDGLKNDERPVTLSDEHRYNLLNQGWYDDLIVNYSVAGTTTPPGSFPSNSMQWILGRNPFGLFAANDIDSIDFGNANAPRGREIYNALVGSRDNIAGGDGGPSKGTTPGGYVTPPLVDFSGAYNEMADNAFTSTAFFAGRVWFAGDVNIKRPNGVYFSKTLSKIEDSGVYMQEGDPTAQYFNAILATDGGVIYITEAATILKLQPYGSGLLVMADNGIWFIYGGTGTGGFTATNFSVEKISSTGLMSPSSVVQTDTAVMYFAENSIQAIALPQTGIVPTVTDIALTKIFTFYANINRDARTRAQGAYDPISKKIFWSYIDSETFGSPTNQSTYTNMLVLDARTGAFTKYSFTTDYNHYFVNGPGFPKRTITGVSTDPNSEFRNSLKVVILDGPGQALRIAEFDDATFTDYAEMASYTPQNYTSYVITGEETLGDLQRNKQATYVHSFFKRTETGFVVDDAGDLVLANPSGCTVQFRWDWHTTDGGNRWSKPQVAYKLRRAYLPTSPSDPLDIGDSIEYTKLKARGKGRSLSVSYTSVPNKDFQLYGWSIAFTASGV